MTMKKNSVLMALSVLLMAGLMFSACPTDGGGDDGGGGLSVPGAGDLPGLPADGGITYVASKDEATALLAALRPGFPTVSSAVNAVINAAQSAAEDASEDGNYSFEVKDNTTVEKLKINASGRYNWSSNVSAEEQGYEPKPGDWMKQTFGDNVTVNFTGDKTASGLTAYQDSVVKSESEGSWDAKLKDNGKADVKISGGEVYAYGLTVSSGGKGGKIVLDARATGALSGEYTDPEEAEDDVSTTYSGSLTVYGADDAEVYKLDIKDEATYDQALGYFHN
jgi:hypothetical protein